MPEAEVLYSDVKFTRGNRGVSEGSQQVKSLSRRSKVTWERVGLLVLGALLAAAVAALGVTVSENLRNKEELKKQEELRKTEACSMQQPTCPTCPTVTQARSMQQPTCPQPPEVKDGPCDRCKAGWEHHGGKCYHFSISKSSWSQSRAECRAEGGDLVKIDNRWEQRFLDGRVRNLMNEDEDKFWIGLTDSAAEGRWMWVDNTPLTERFWLIGEPDNWRGKTPEGENCVRMGEKGGAPDLKNWNDASCSDPHRSICEKAEVTGQIKYVCT
ncbi:C-type lectin domain family 4 member F-like isoform X2 [Archocentrus centrarchus]|uniref:C-type lectin domain family 4 member F-like isoform X2 n=1 Tax=Archocentrus centrarchus TaxID=63155 RepID=UPI0011EA286A|nr:C-type lectin domain family 4 member F-like isoform X2 [Archocentrus centrarchus]